MGCRLYGLFLVRAFAPFPRHMLDVSVLDMVQLGVCVCLCFEPAVFYAFAKHTETGFEMKSQTTEPKRKRKSILHSFLNIAEEHL